ncbi:MAG: type I glyceraldehyde-3-phosphate dehydrogenase [Myxococcales bacterium]|nr:type I glyceraldehyde-3-phosphate dehydrogenase [Myxococcales bacterium]MDH3845084.1 type I glyceraldehyde-3-phosphate dehydrogenase [Myxococcales bacterium]
MATKIGINGFGRIGRCVARVIAEGAPGDVELVGINDLTSAEMLAHLLEWDSVHGQFSHPVKAEDEAIWIGDHRVPVSAERDPSKLKWKELGAEIVLECTGLFRSQETASAHLKAGAERVIISAPARGDVDGTFCVGINSDQFDPSKDRIISCASCTTNCLAPLAKVLNDTFGIVKGHMVTVHSYTNDQRILDLPHSDMRRARAAALSIIPTSTGAAKAIGLVLPELKGKLDGTAIRVPTPNVSLTCLTAQVGRSTSREEVNKALKEAADGPLRGILAFEERPLVSIDFTGNPHSSIVDAAQTQVVGGDLVEVQSWYDNEWGFSQRMVDLVRIASSAG